jgi:hypothetical protein
MDASLSQAAAYIRDVSTDTSGNPILFLIIWLEGAPMTPTEPSKDFTADLNRLAQYPHVSTNGQRHFSNGALIKLVSPRIDFHILKGPGRVNNLHQD